MYETTHKCLQSAVFRFQGSNAGFFVIHAMTNHLPVVIYDLQFGRPITRMSHGLGKAQTKGWAFYPLTHKSDDWSKIRRHGSRPVLAIMRLSVMDDDFASRFRTLTHRHKNVLLFASDLPAEALPDRITKLGLRDLSRIHLSDRKAPAEQVFLVERWLSVLAGKNADHCITDAWWDGDHLVVISPRFERLRVPISMIPSLRGKPIAELCRFEIDEDGSYVFWPLLDVHLGWDQLAQSVNPLASLKVSQNEEDFNRRYGAAIRQLREAHEN